MYTVFGLSHHGRRVKLNNPLMGTETIKILATKYHYSFLPVKLNNPLMGTETWCNYWCEYDIHTERELN